MRKLEEWIDFMEGECDLKEMSKLGLLLKHSISDQVVLDNLRRLRRVTKQCDRADEINAAIADENRMAALHLNTMKRIADQIKIDSRRQEKVVSTDDAKTTVVLEALET